MEKRHGCLVAAEGEVLQAQAMQETNRHLKISHVEGLGGKMDVGDSQVQSRLVPHVKHATSDQGNGAGMVQGDWLHPSHYMKVG